jgi:hypothetical protein
MSDTLGFILLRHVCDTRTDTYWKLSYEHIRKWYPENPILIVDDNSNYAYIDKKYESCLYKTTVLRGEYPGRGELLPYYYFLKTKPFDTACIIHDSVFINSHLDLKTDTYKLLWEFEHNWDEPAAELHILSIFEHSDILRFYNNTSAWKGCFGAMTVIRHDFLEEVNKTFDISKLLDHITTRWARMRFERILACIFQFYAPRKTLLGNIHAYCRFGVKYEDVGSLRHLPVIKVWTGR